MQISELKSETSTALHAFVWDQWAQMGVSASTKRADRWAADPEALLLLTLEVGRDEPRLFDEVLDWLVTNERLISVQRLRNLTRDEEDRALVDAALGSVARWRPRARLIARAADSSSALPVAPQAFFRVTRSAVTQPDDVFLRHGWLKTQVPPSRKSRAPAIEAPINFAFRLRNLLGVGARAEVVRILLCSDAPHLSVQDLAESAAYAKRNVQAALTSLHAAKVIDAVTVRNEQRYGTPRDRWAQLLGLTVDQLPSHRDWSQFFWALRRLTRWLETRSSEELSDYMRASEARALIDDIATDLRLGGVPVPDSDARGADCWPDFVNTVHAVLNMLS